MTPTDAPKKRGGSKKGRTFQRVNKNPPRAEGDVLRKRDFRVWDSHYSVLLRIGAGDATAGLRKLCDAQLLVEGKLGPSEK